MKDLELDPVMISKRANIFYIEHARVVRTDDTVMFLTEDRDSKGLFFNIPEKNTSLLLLGTGTSITNAAAQKLAECNVVVSFCGSRGFPIYSATDISFLCSQSQYRPTEYMQKYIQLWWNEEIRLQMAKELMIQRVNITNDFWSRNESLKILQVNIKQKEIEKFINDVRLCTSSQELLLTEGRFSKSLYARIAEVYTPGVFRREIKPKSNKLSDVINNMLNHGNYIAYGCAAVVLHTLGISFAFPMLHGETRRGALVFDIADLFKDACIMPLAFECGKQNITHTKFRHRVLDLLYKEKILDMIFEKVESLIKNFHEKQ